MGLYQDFYYSAFFPLAFPFVGVLFFFFFLQTETLPFYTKVCGNVLFSSTFSPLCPLEGWWFVFKFPPGHVLLLLGLQPLMGNKSHPRSSQPPTRLFFELVLSEFTRSVPFFNLIFPHPFANGNHLRFCRTNFTPPRFRLNIEWVPPYAGAWAVFPMVIGLFPSFDYPALIINFPTLKIRLSILTAFRLSIFYPFCIRIGLSISFVNFFCWKSPLTPPKGLVECLYFSAMTPENDFHFCHISGALFRQGFDFHMALRKTLFRDFFQKVFFFL